MLLVHKCFFSSGRQKAVLHRKQKPSPSTWSTLSSGRCHSFGWGWQTTCFYKPTVTHHCSSQKCPYKAQPCSTPSTDFSFPSPLSYSEIQMVWAPVLFMQLEEDARGLRHRIHLPWSSLPCLPYLIQWWAYVLNIWRRSEQEVSHLLMGLKFSTCMKLSRTAVLFKFSKLLLKSFKKVFNLDDDALSVHSINIFSKQYQFKKRNVLWVKSGSISSYFVLLICFIKLPSMYGM